MAETLSYNAIRTANLVRELDEQKTEARRKNLLILVVKYLYDEGYVESAKSLERETNINLSRFEVCDNVNLETVFLDFEAYYHVRLKRQPQIIKKVPNGDVANRKPSNSCPAVKRIASLPKLRSETKPPSTPPSGSVRPTSANKKLSQKGGFSNGGTSNGSCENLSLQGLLVTQNATSAFTSSSEGNHVQPKLPKTGKPIIDFRAMINDATKLPNTEGTSEDKLLKPLGSYMGYSTEWRELAQVIQQDIYSQNPNVKWDDIIGLDNAKSLVKESVVYPIKYPQLFTGILSAWKGLLLYGPPGTGKTLLAKAVATECKTTFFNISASSIVSKWRGDSEKLVRVLFELARHHAPSTIFLDELDALMSQRGGQAGGGEHEGSRRMKTELLVQMDGLAKTDDLVFLLAASNIPWELDHAMLRRLEKRILVGLPTPEARRAMFQHYLPPVVCSASTNGIDLSADLDYEHLAELTEGYSGSDIRLVCKEAAMKPVRKVFAALENLDEGVDLQIHLDTITMSDAEAALANTKPSARGITQKYFDWQQEFESV